MGSRGPSDISRVKLGDKMGLDGGNFENQTEDFYSVCDHCRQYCYLPTQQMLLTLLFSLLAEQIINSALYRALAYIKKAL